MLIRTNILQKTLVGCSRINSVFCDSAKCGFFIQASLFRPGFELSQTVDFKKGVAFWNNSTCVNQSITESHRHFSRKTSDLTIVSQSAVIGHIKKKKRPALIKNTTQTANSRVLSLKDRSMNARFP